MDLIANILTLPPLPFEEVLQWLRHFFLSLEFVTV